MRKTLLEGLTLGIQWTSRDGMSPLGLEGKRLGKQLSGEQIFVKKTGKDPHILLASGGGLSSLLQQKGSG